MICLNARFTGQPMTGVQRAAHELGRRLISMRSDVVALAAAPPAPEYDLPVTVVPGLSGHAWEQATLPRRVGRSDLLVGLGGTGPVTLSRQIVMIHDVNYLLGPDAYSRRFRIAYRAIQSVLMKRAAICTVSHWSARQIAKAFDVEESRIAVIPNAADHILSTAPDPGAPRTLGLADRPYVLCVGSANPNKNFATALAAYAALDDPEFDLVIVGGGDARIFAGSTLSSHPRVHRLPRISDGALRTVMEEAKGFLMPSLLEGFGIPAIEAMALGTSVIAADAAALPEVCADAAMLVDPRDAGEMGAAMQKLCANAELRADLADRGRKRAAQFSWDTSARKLSDLIDSAIRHRG
ncbi:glycosyltransferase family 4 protein [Croceicoccus sediminis]|uniref:glycosyltransferase family 4 protein n=1 Tax=Croceicoccus sediminis TaxID=2571150 RepID=UPI0014782963|nr:glycosyltransferase family 1 protein [Croceicoccus sediminis]